MGKYKEAVEEFRNFPQRFPESKFKNESYYWAGEALFNLENYKEAKNYYKKFYDLMPEHPLSDDALNGVAWCEYKSGALKPSLAAFNMLISKYPDSELIPAALFRTGNINLKLSKSNDALKAFQKLVEKYPKDRIAIDAHLELGKLYTQKKEYSKASPHFIKAQESEIIEMKTEASYYLGESEAAREKYNDAIAAYERIINYGISDMSWVSLAYVKIGVNKERLKLWDDARASYQMALEILEDKDLKTFAEGRLKVLKAREAGKN